MNKDHKTMFFAYEILIKFLQIYIQNFLVLL